MYSSITNKMQRYTMVFITINALHVSGGSSAHHQELKTVYTASGICRAFTPSYRYRGCVGIYTLNTCIYSILYVLRILAKQWEIIHIQAGLFLCGYSLAWSCCNATWNCTPLFFNLRDCVQFKTIRHRWHIIFGLRWFGMNKMLCVGG
jgi:hypothetical protein